MTVRLMTPRGLAPSAGTPRTGVNGRILRKYVTGFRLLILSPG